jgi:hypothetical protein
MDNLSGSWLRRAEVALFALVVVLAIGGGALLPLTTPAYVGLMVRAVGSADRTGLGLASTLETAEHVRRFVTDREAPALPPEIGGRPAYDDAAVAHLVDVRKVLVPARRLALGSATLGLGWALVRRRTREGRAVLAAALAGAGWSLLAVAGLAALAGAADFDALFARFHSLFFASGTWLFPEGALLIEVFPLAFWVASGVLWGFIVAACSGAAVVTARRIRFTVGNNGV